MVVGKIFKEDALKSISDAIDVEMNNKKIPKGKRESFAGSLIRDSVTLQIAKGDTLDDVRKYASEAKRSNHTKSLISGIAGITVSVLGMAAGVVFKRPEFVFAILPAFIGMAASKSYEDNSLSYSKTEEVAAQWENLYAETKAAEEEAVKKAIESIPEAVAKMKNARFEINAMRKAIESIPVIGVDSVKPFA